MDSVNTRLTTTWARSLSLGIALLTTSSVRADLAQNAIGLLKTYCGKCHGVERNGSDSYDVYNLTGLIAGNYVVPGNPAASKVYKRIQDGTMPPEGVPHPTPAEIEVIKQWITEGARSPGGSGLNEPADQYVLRNIVSDIQKNAEGEARNFRYLSLTNVPASSVPRYHAAIAKTLNSLTFKADITLPVTVDPAGLVVRFDQRDFGFNDDQWRAVLAAYPYVEAPAYIRADWFIANALQPPLYNILLRLPNNEADFERLFGVNTRGNVRAARVVRAGILNSGVAFHNRVVERHATRFGSYWKSYDFASDQGRENIIRFPLGPVGTGFDGEAFREAGGEIIASLPNGLHAYFVVNNQGQRLDSVPTGIAADRKQVSGNLDITPGLSCMACHQNGIQDRFQDVVRLGTRFSGEAGRRIQTIYAEPDRMRAFTEYDKQRYLSAVRAATGSVEEPVGGLALNYQRPLDIKTAAVEVGGYPPAAIEVLIKGDARLRELILPLARGGTVSRAGWESKDLGQSPAQRLAELLRN
jgi:hypothetical protein